MPIHFQDTVYLDARIIAYRAVPAEVFQEAGIDETGASGSVEDFSKFA